MPGSTPISTKKCSFLQELVRVPTDTPPGNNAPHAERTAELLAAMGLNAEQHAVPDAEVKAVGMESVTNLILRRRYGDGGKTIALNAHGDVVPPGEGWTHDPYGGEIVDGQMYGRATAVSKCDIASFTFAIRALESLGAQLAGGVELHVTYDEEFGGVVGPDWLLNHGLTKPDLMIAAGFSYQVVVAHNGCLQLEATVNGDMAHAAIPDSGTDALQAATHILNALYALNTEYLKVTSKVEGITHPYLNVGQIVGGTNTNVIPGKVVLKIDRRMIPEEDPAEVEASHSPHHRRGSGELQPAARRTRCDGGRQAPAAVARHEAAAGQPAAGASHPATRASCHGRIDSRAGHAAVHRCAPVCGARHSGRDLRRRPAHRAGVARQARRRTP